MSKAVNLERNTIRKGERLLIFGNKYSLEIS